MYINKAKCKSYSFRGNITINVFTRSQYSPVGCANGSIVCPRGTVEIDDAHKKTLAHPTIFLFPCSSLERSHGAPHQTSNPKICANNGNTALAVSELCSAIAVVLGNTA